MLGHAGNTNQIALLPVPALAVVDIVTFSFEHEDELFRNMAVPPRTAAGRYLVKVNVFAFGRDHHFRMNQPFDPSLPGPLPELFFLQYAMRRRAAEIGLFMH